MPPRSYFVDSHGPRSSSYGCTAHTARVKRLESRILTRLPMEILKYPDPRLLKPCKDVIVFGTELKVLLESMWETMKRERGIGMAANQVGLEYRMFVMDETIEKHFIINPKVIDIGKYPCDQQEGCLSAPGQMVKLYRPNWVTIAYQNESGEHRRRTFVGVHSVCVQHEMEHLYGKTFLQNKAIPSRIRKELAKKWVSP